jgi:hypothetical protein
MHALSICLREKGAYRYNRYTASGVRSQCRNFIQQFESVHTRHFNVGQRQIWMSIFYRFKALKRTPFQPPLVNAGRPLGLTTLFRFQCPHAHFRAFHPPDRAFACEL